MKASYVVILAVATSLTALADFSYTSTTKGSGMMSAANNSSTHYFKGQKMKMDMGGTGTVMIMDFDAQTMTSINTSAKTYTVTKFSDLGQTMKDVNADVKIDVRDTGQKRDINGFACHEVIMTMETTMETKPDTGRGGQPTKDAGRGGQPMKMNMEM